MPHYSPPLIGTERGARACWPAGAGTQHGVVDLNVELKYKIELKIITSCCTSC